MNDDVKIYVSKSELLALKEERDKERERANKWRQTAAEIGTENSKLRDAIRAHRDNFPDEPLENEYLLWQVLDEVEA